MGGGTGTGEEKFSKNRNGLRKLSASEGNFLHKFDLIGKLIDKIPNHKEINGMDFISNLQLVDRDNKNMNYLHRAEIILSGESEGNLCYVFGIEKNSMDHIPLLLTSDSVEYTLNDRDAGKLKGERYNETPISDIRKYLFLRNGRKMQKFIGDSQNVPDSWIHED